MVVTWEDLQFLPPYPSLYWGRGTRFDLNGDFNVLWVAKLHCEVLSWELHSKGSNPTGKFLPYEGETE